MAGEADMRKMTQKFLRQNIATAFGIAVGAQEA
jgi:hypothetical protein